ncbi:MAG: Protein-arginine kinase [Chlamydiia bacterium]|nr:Protein-arginine kinase [Chlamydiia bacterium]
MNNPSLKASKIATSLSPWNVNENIIWLASTLALHRNIEKFKFPQKLDTDKKKHILSLVAKTILTSPNLVNPFTIKGEDLSPIEKNFLLEHFLIFEGFSEVHQGEAVVVDDTGQFIGLFNLKDHIHLQYTDISGNLENSWNRLLDIENSLTSSLSFAFSPKFGFLTADPQLCGTGFVITAYLHVPCLIQMNEVQGFFEKDANESILCCGLQGSPQDLIGDLLTVRNVYTLGMSEESIISTLRAAILKLVVAEKDLRTKIKAEGSAFMKDKISRAIGTLKFSYQLDTVEALAAISLVKLGIELGWVQGISVKEMNQIFFACRKAHLNYSLKEKASIENVLIQRAEFIRSKIKAITYDFIE